MKMIIKGFKIETCDMQAVEEILKHIQEKVEKRAKAIYAELLANEIELFVDDISLNILERPENDSIYNCSINELNKKISWATGNNAPTKYNFGVQAAIFTYKSETYIKLNIKNEALMRQIKNIPDAEDFSVMDFENKENNQRGVVWNEIGEIYCNSNNPMIKQLFPNGPIDVNWDLISTKFKSREKRAETRARYQLTSDILNLIGMKSEIPNFRLLPYLDETAEMFNCDEVKAEFEKLKKKALSVLVNITEAEVKRNPNAEPPHTFEEAKDAHSQKVTN